MNITEFEKYVYGRAKDVFGVQAQILVAIEECGEFIHGASRFVNQRENNMVEEIGDVLVMMMQLIEILDIEDVVQENVTRKLIRLVNKMNHLENK